MALRLSNFSDKLDFDARAERNLRHAKGAAGMPAFFAEHFDEELGSPVGDQMLLRESGRTVHQDKQFYDACDLVEIPERGVERRQEVDRDAAGRFLALRGKEFFTKLAGPGLSVFLGDVAGNEKK